MLYSQQQAIANLSLNAQPLPQQGLTEFENLCQILYGSSTDPKVQSRQQAEQALLTLKTVDNLAKFLHFLDGSRVVYAQYLAANCIKEIFVDNWMKIDLQTKKQFKETLLNFIV